MEKDAPLNDPHLCDKLFICVAPGCNNSSVTNKSLQFHGFPDLETCKIWQNCLGIGLKTRNSMDAVCSEHFRDEDYQEEMYLEGNVVKTRRTLKPLALPRVFQPDRYRQKNYPQLRVKDEDEHLEIMPQTVSRRDDKGITALTQKFMEILKSCPEGLLDLSHAVKELKISKRRIYDITNVLQGVFLVKKKSKSVIQWLGYSPDMFDDSLKSLTEEEKKLDDLIKSVKQHIYEMHENALHHRYAYVTYDDLQNISIFEDQTLFVIKAPPETTLAVTHPKEAFQLHISSTNGPVYVLGRTDPVTPNMRQKSKFDDGDYSNIPFRGFSTAAASFKDNANQKTKSDNISTKKTSIQNSNINASTEPKAVIPPLRVQNCSAPIGPLSICIKEEINNWNISPEEPMIESFAPEPDHLSTDVHMTDFSES